MSERAAQDRRAASLRETQRPGPARRLVSALRDGLYRPLAEDDDRAAYWVRHVRNGVLLSEVAAASVIGYLLLTSTPGRHHPVLLALCGLVMLLCPTLLLLPLCAMMRDSRGPTLFYAWSLATTALVVVGARLDGGATSPLDALLFLTLGYLAGAYSPYGVVAMGTLMSGSYLLFVELPDPSTSGLFFLTVMLAFTMICAMNSANSWARTTSRRRSSVPRRRWRPPTR